MIRLLALVLACLPLLQDPPPVDPARARELLQKQRRGEALTPEEAAELKRANQERTGRRPTGAAPRETTGLKPLDEMTADDRYKGEDGGLYGGGRNGPSDDLRRAAEAQLARVEALDAGGKPAAEGRIVLLSISMSNATQEFSRFKKIADGDAGKSSKLTIVDGAQGGMAMAEWASAEARAWTEVDRRLAAAGVTAAQVQIAWIKLANKTPTGDLEAHGRKLQKDAQAVVANAKARFPNLRIAHLSSRIYAGYAASNLNPEPYAYEGAFVVRWMIKEQALDGPGPVLLWGPYLWADGTTPRASDKLVWLRDDLARDGTHPSESGKEKVARMLLSFFKSDPLAKPWFCGR